MRDEFQTSKRQDVCRAKCRPRPECTLHSRAANRKQPLEGVGMVAMILEEDVTAFWLFNIDSTTGKVLMSK